MLHNLLDLMVESEKDIKSEDFDFFKAKLSEHQKQMTEQSKRLEENMNGAATKLQSQLTPPNIMQQQGLPQRQPQDQGNLDRKGELELALQRQRYLAYFRSR